MIKIDKSKIVKIGIASVIAIFAIGYYFINNNETDEYEDILSENIVVENKTETTETEEISKIKVYVTGEVNSPGVIELDEGARIEDAIQGAGGITAEANLKNINLAYEIEDGEKIYIPNVSEPDEDVEEQTDTTSSSNSSSSSSKGKININKATSDELTSIPGVGESTADKIISYREENGKFSTIEDIKNVSGIGDGKYEKMKDYISVK